jgi:hypothetical protein
MSSNSSVSRSVRVTNKAACQRVPLSMTMLEGVGVPSPISIPVLEFLVFLDITEERMGAVASCEIRVRTREMVNRRIKSESLVPCGEI